MAAKVVGDKPVKTYKIICNKCGYELEYTGEDIRVKDTGYHDIYSYIRCPRTTYFYENSVKKEF